MNRPLPFIALFAVLSTAACAAAPEETEGAGGAVTAGPVAPHANAVEDCDTQHDEGIDDSATTEADIRRRDEAWQACFATANDGAVARIEANLKESGSSLAGSSKAAIARMRAAHERLCKEQDRGSSSFGGRLFMSEAASCRAHGEVLTGALIGSYVSLGGVSRPMSEDRAAHPKCYADFDKASRTATATNEVIQTLATLRGCITAAYNAFAEPIAKVQVVNGSSAGSVAASTARIEEATAGLADAATELCQVLNEAGPNGPGSESRVSGGACTVRVAEWTHRSLQGTVGGVGD